MTNAIFLEKWNETSIISCASYDTSLILHLSAVIMSVSHGTDFKNRLQLMYLVPEALVHTERLCVEAMSDPQLTHEISQVNSPHTFRDLQVQTRSL